VHLVTELDRLVADRLREVALAGTDWPHDVHGRQARIDAAQRSV
jgi:hypothetical protein